MPYTYTSVSDPVYATPDDSKVRVTVKFDHLPNPVLFVANPKDVEPHGRQIYADVIAGKYGPIGPYVAVPRVAVVAAPVSAVAPPPRAPAAPVAVSAPDVPVAAPAPHIGKAGVATNLSPNRA